jgi:hypothetical protein
VHTNQQEQELEAFCSSCPTPEEVIAFLKRLDMYLDFQMDAFLPPAHSEIAELPAQFHFEHVSGMNIIYLAGEDKEPEDGVRLPVHKSRFWAYSGWDDSEFNQITQRVAHQWSFTWLHRPEARQEVA